MMQQQEDETGKPVLLGSPAQAARDAPPPSSTSRSGKVAVKNTFIDGTEDELVTPCNRRFQTCPAPHDKRGSGSSDEDSASADSTSNRASNAAANTNTNTTTSSSSAATATRRSRQRFGAAGTAASSNSPLEGDSTTNHRRVSFSDLKKALQEDYEDSELPSPRTRDNRSLFKTEDLQECFFEGGLNDYIEGGPKCTPPTEQQAEKKDMPSRGMYRSTLPGLEESSSPAPAPTPAPATRQEAPVGSESTSYFESSSTSPRRVNILSCSAGSPMSTGGIPPRSDRGCIPGPCHGNHPSGYSTTSMPVMQSPPQIPPPAGYGVPLGCSGYPYMPPPMPYSHCPMPQVPPPLPPQMHHLHGWPWYPPYHPEQQVGVPPPSPYSYPQHLLPHPSHHLHPGQPPLAPHPVHLHAHHGAPQGHLDASARRAAYPQTTSLPTPGEAGRSGCRLHLPSRPVDTADDEEEDTELTTPSNARNRGGARRLRLWAHIYLHMQVPGFDLVPRLIGRGGCNMRRIADQTGAKVRIRGKGSGHLEIDGEREAPTPLMVAVTTDKADQGSFRSAIAMTLQELRNVETRFHVHCQKQNIEHEGPCFSIGLLPNNGKEILADIISGVPMSALPARTR
mmetsp:Transcript_1365/g.3028  ORF Transcript_1365/g.3028 Transcript_1365/m.3028 type:complete len:620 (+) Transcript_1365:160-2019(+)